MTIHLTENHFHPHLNTRMKQRGITRTEIEKTLNTGHDAPDAKPGTIGKVKTFAFEGEWEGKYYKEKQVIVYYKQVADNIILLTAIAKYGDQFSREQ